MKISNSLRLVLMLGLFMPITLFVVGIYNGLMQVLYRSGLLHQSEFLHINYYQGLTLHGVINAVVLTTFFAVVFGHVIMANYLKKEPPKWSYQLSMILMVIGTLADAVVMLSGKAEALYTFYAPLKDSPIFYVGTAILIVGSWVAFFGWIVMYKDWKKENPTAKMPIAVLGNLVNFTIWFTCTIPVAIEVLVILTPWSLGWINQINIPLTRMLFWMFGHALVYFWLLPAYIAFYTILPKLLGGKLFSGNAARLAFLLFLLLSLPIGIHHQFSEPVFSQGTKFWVTILTFAVAIPSFMTAFNVGASMEYAGKKRGATGPLGWMLKQPYFKKNNYLVGYFICGLILFIFGGLSGIVNASYSLNAVIHNTSWVPGHFHMTVAGPVAMVIMGMSLFIYSSISGKNVHCRTFATIMPYLWTIGMAMFSHGLMAGGLMGEPRRTNMGMTYTNPNNSLFNAHWVPTSTLTLIGGIFLTAAAALYFIAFFTTAFSKSIKEPSITLPMAEELHEEKPVPLLLNMKPWLILNVILLLISYVPAINSIRKNSISVPNKFEMESPVNQISTTKR